MFYIKSLRIVGITISILLLVFVPFVSHGGTSSSTTINHVQLEKQLSQLLLNEPNLNGAISGISIRATETGEMLYEHNGDIRLRPASNMKLLTAAAALNVLGENYTFQTKALTDGKILWNVLRGNLYLKGGGDPTLLKEDLDHLAKELKAKGVKIINGDIIGDDTWYDDVRHSVDLPWSDETTYYGAQISALTVSPNKDYDAGTVIVNVGPGKKVGEKGIMTLQPSTDYIQVINKTVTVSERSKPTEITVERKHGTNKVIVEGEVAVDAHENNYWVSVWEPTKYALSLFEKSLKEQGIQLLGDIKTGKTPERATTLATHQSMPLSQLLIPFMKLSNNGHAEVLVKEMGRTEKGEGSWDKGLEVMENELFAMGIDVDRFVIRDGSGVSHINLVTANGISKLLYIIQGKEWYLSFVRSLPVAGNGRKMSSGTLGNRMKELANKANIKAKTGTITSVSSLSGYIEREGDDIIFSIMLNNLNDDQKGKEVEDKIVEILVTF